MGIFHLFFGFSGRINRGKYWLTLVIWLLIWIVAIVAILVSGFAIFDRNLKDVRCRAQKTSTHFGPWSGTTAFYPSLFSCSWL
jgi:uncharacterized membrane protein YhaH (DUF805 family)